MTNVHALSKPDGGCRIGRIRYKRGNVEPLAIVTRQRMPARKMLASAYEADLDECIVIGIERSTGEFYFAGTEPDAGTALYLMELARKRPMEICDA